MDKQKPDREAVKVLAIAVGVREAARRMNLSESTVKSWSTRDQWFKQPILPPTIPKPNGASIASITPSAALEKAMKSRHSKSRLNLSKYVVNASKVASRSRKPLEDAPLVDKVANVMAKVWPEEQQGSSGGLNLSVLGQALIQVNTKQ